ncbi:MAG TPA: Na+/H+ antiporter [Aggregatilineales bacterium]|nr:Na+/H+ antiporter [Aggregatilineales bacterium]
MTSIFALESLAIVLLLVIALVALVTDRLRIPYTVALVLVGLAITFRGNLKAEVTPDLILALFIPPVAFEAAFRLDWRHVRENLPQILGLAIPGVILSTLVVGGTVFVLNVGIALPLAALFGALISATDPVAVVALFKASNVSRRLHVVIESESLLNDGTAIVLFNIALAVALTGAFDPVGGLFDFVQVSLGGVAVGSILGWTVARLLVHIDDHLVETTLTTCLAFGSYLLATSLHTSGILSVVAAGLFCGTLGTKGMSPTTKIVVSTFWEYLAFIANSFVFLLIGLTIQFSQLSESIGPIVAAIVAVLFSRAVVVYGSAILFARKRRTMSLAETHVLFWGGLRGAVSLALALSLPAVLDDHSTLRAMTFGVVLFTLLVQATTMPWLLRRLGLVRFSPKQIERDLRLGRLVAGQAAWQRLQQLHEEGILTGEIWTALEAQYRDESRRLAEQLQELYMESGELERDLVINARREALRAERAALTEAARRGLIADEAFRRLIAEVDNRLEAVLMHLPDVGPS